MRPLTIRSRRAYFVHGWVVEIWLGGSVKVVCVQGQWLVRGKRLLQPLWTRA